jgi:DNA-binding CsgD family transcriptional regulator
MTRIYIVISVIFILDYGFVLQMTQQSGDQTQIHRLYNMLLIFSLLVRFFAMTFAFIGSYLSKNAKRKKLIRTLCIYYFVFFALHYYLGLLASFAGTAAWIHIRHFLYFILNVPPLFILKRFLSRNFSETRKSFPEKENLEPVFRHYGLTKREEEVFLLMIEGKSNPEIKNNLFLSIKTVKNHIHSIYKKMGLSSRTQLLAFLQKLQNGE